MGSLTTDRPTAAWGLAIGPIAFVSAWAVGGALTSSYSPIDDAISRIAAVGAPHRALMTAGFLIYGAAVLVGSLALRGSLIRAAWPFAAVNALATVAVAATPLEHSDLVDTLHGVAAGVGYVALAAMALAAVRPLYAAGHRSGAWGSLAAGTISALCLIATTSVEANGLFQRAGLGAGDVWLVVVGLTLARSGRVAPAAEPHSL